MLSGIVSSAQVHLQLLVHTSMTPSDMSEASSQVSSVHCSMHIMHSQPACERAGTEL